MTPKTAADWHTPDAVNVLYTAMPPALDDSEEADASDVQSEDLMGIGFYFDSDAD